MKTRTVLVEIEVTKNFTYWNPYEPFIKGINRKLSKVFGEDFVGVKRIDDNGLILQHIKKEEE